MTHHFSLFPSAPIGMIAAPRRSGCFLAITGDMHVGNSLINRGIVVMTQAGTIECTV